MTVHSGLIGLFENQLQACHPVIEIGPRCTILFRGSDDQPPGSGGWVECGLGS
jgi:hypothetical protein